MGASANILLVTVGGIATDNDPNTTEPSGDGDKGRARAIFYLYGEGPGRSRSGQARIWVTDGTSLVVTPWYKDLKTSPQATRRWVQLAASLTVTPAAEFIVNNIPPGCDLFFQMGTNTGNVTTFGAIFL